MPRPDLNRVASFFQNYINQVRQDDLLPALRELGNDFISLVKTIPASKHDHAYAEGKWTLRELFQHIIDTERILSYRALCFARKETQSLPGFDENTYAASSKAANRSWNDMIEEFSIVRKASEYLFASFDHEQLESGGKANNKPMYVLGLGFVVAGHCQHHVNIIKEKYL
jgi:DinB superfamily